MIKRLRRSAPAQQLLASIVACFIWCVHRTTRWRHVGFKPVAQFEASQRPFIVCCWHGRMLLTCCFRPRTMPVQVLASRHNDGQFVARVMAFFGVGSVSGWTGRGGHGAIQACWAALTSGCVVVITPDGPRGPALQVAPGVIRLARLSGAAIVPVSYSTNRRRFLKTWDRFMIPLPFGSGVFVCGPPLSVAESTDEDWARNQLQHALNQASWQADRLTGHTAAEPRFATGE